MGLKFFILGNILKKKYKLYLEKTILYANDLANLTENKNWSDSLYENGDCLIISKNKFENIKFFGWWKSEINEIFNEEIYNFLPVKNKTVVDIGANVGDSVIYFCKKDAKKIIAIEPFIKNFRYAKKNLEINNFADKVILIQSACSDTIKKIKLDSSKEGTGLHISENENGVEIQTTTLENLVNEYNLENAVLKMDCEDCEYETILTSSFKTLKSFSHIAIEYHHGFEKLKEKLENCDFNVIVSEEEKTKLKESGYIFATQNI